MLLNTRDTSNAIPFGLVLVVPFVISWMTFHYPIATCDSPSWAHSYLGRLIGKEVPIITGSRGWIIPLYFHFIGDLSIRMGVPNLIGLVQACYLFIALASFLYFFKKNAGSEDQGTNPRKKSKWWRLEFLLYPAIFLSFVRYAEYSQTIMSEPLVMVLYLCFWNLLLRDQIGKWQLFLATLCFALLFHLRIDSLYLIVLLLGKCFIQREGRFIRLCNTGLIFILSSIALYYPLLPNWQPYPPIGKVMTIAEWARYTSPPQNSVAQALSFDLTEEISRAKPDEMQTINDGFDVALSVATGPRSVSWGQILRLQFYQVVNHPAWVITDRAGTFLDLYASAYASFWPEYRPWSAHYGTFGQLFSGWTIEQFNRFENSCPDPGRAQEAYYQRPSIKSHQAFAALRSIHQVSVPYVQYVLRPILLLLLPGSLLLLLFGRAGASFAWMTFIVYAHHLFRAIFICAEERYQLPIDLLTLCWALLALRHIQGLLVDALGDRGSEH